MRGTINLGILYSQKGSQECVGFSDADWAGDVNDRKSTSGYLFLISGGAVTSNTGKKDCISMAILLIGKVWKGIRKGHIS